MSKKFLKIVGLGALCLVLAFSVNAVATHAKDTDTVYEGVYIGTVDVSGKTLIEAEEIAENVANEVLSTPVTLTCNNKSITVEPETIGLTWVNTNIAEDAISVGRNGNLIKRFKDRKDLEKSEIRLKLIFEVDEGLFKEYLEANAAKLNVDAVDNSIKLTDAGFEFIEGCEGVEVLINESIEEIEIAYAEGILEPITEFELESDITEPRGTREELGKVKDVLAKFSTNYSTSAAGRCQNVANATSLINGTVVYPGETFSVHDTISPISLDNGYAMAGAYENGTVVEAVGGGVCQVSSTLYNAVIRAELEVVERSPHSMIVTYVQASQDAAIAGDYKDFKFKNNTDYPIYIQGYTSNKNVYFVIYGCETRDSNREVSFETEIESEDNPDPVFNTCDQPIGYVEKVQGTHVGYKCVLYKVVKVNGQVVSREVFNRSTYKASAAIYNIGIKSSHPEAVKAMKEAIATGDIQKIKDAAGYWSDEAIRKRTEEPDEPSDDDDNDGE
ncbi:MAG: VanW family protein [Lachnospiraceae bacterium]|nr:VanW family protein [Lachnospiraceae bacterium]